MQLRPRPLDPDHVATEPGSPADPAMAYALENLAHYRTGKDRARILYQSGEILLLLVTAGTTVAAALGARAALTATLAAIAVVLTGVRRLFDWQFRWITCADAWSRIRILVTEYGLLEAPGPAARAELTRRVNAVVTEETTGWASRRAEHLGGE
jgi:hypothetical protein